MSAKPVLTANVFLQVADHTLLASDTTAAVLDDFIAGAETLGVKRVCVLPSLLPVDKRGREIVTVVGFPSGAHKSEVKAFETARAVNDGADEIDMVVNLGLVRAGEWEQVEADIRAVRKACPGLVLKVILETATLSDEEIVQSCKAAEAAGADFVKTSTGFHAAGGASVHAVRLMKATVGDRLGVKASGGIRDAATARDMWAAGATRFGVSATASIHESWNITGEATEVARATDAGSAGY